MTECARPPQDVVRRHVPTLPAVAKEVAPLRGRHLVQRHKELPGEETVTEWQALHSIPYKLPQTAPTERHTAAQRARRGPLVVSKVTVAAINVLHERLPRERGVLAAQVHPSAVLKWWVGAIDVEGERKPGLQQLAGKRAHELRYTVLHRYALHLKVWFRRVTVCGVHLALVAQGRRPCVRNFYVHLDHIRIGGLSDAALHIAGDARELCVVIISVDWQDLHVHCNGGELLQ
mmetsp:Transcript_10702/g.37163  ORF Transcript_10702/g.37163 Transcript_10702/m.37163 type:complete len:232 (-) Transcript_10702:236-931(-)